MAPTKPSVKPYFKPNWPLALVQRASAALFLIANAALAQDASLKPVTVNAAASAPQADVTGFGDVPLKEVPLSATVVTRQQLEASGALVPDWMPLVPLRISMRSLLSSGIEVSALIGRPSRR